MYTPTITPAPLRGVEIPQTRNDLAKSLRDLGSAFHLALIALLTLAPIPEFLPSFLHLALKLLHLLPLLPVFLGILNCFFSFLPRPLTLILLRAPNRDVTGAEIAKEPLEHYLDDPATNVVNDHDCRHSSLEFICELDQLHLLVQVRDEFS